ncbi:MAG: MerR family transcriptional regulator [Solirubrobacterales bacterium]|nr:MerR family transcriptional regulator [Solirubrobacterales bacterium]
MVKGGQTVSATDFASLTGVSRERLRTWERRHAFPEPIRAGGGARRYAIDDVPRVVAVRRAVESGVPLTAAVEATGLRAEAGISSGAHTALAEHAPVAVVALSGPEPLRVEFVNAAVRLRPGAPAPGDDLLDLAPWFAEEPGCATLRRLFTDDLVAAGCEHPDWTAGLRSGAQSIAYRLPHEPGERPLVALIGIDTARERRTTRELAELERQAEELREQSERDMRFFEALEAVTDLFRRGSGMDRIAEATTLLVRRLSAVDVALAPSMAGSLTLGRSARGLLGPEMVTVTRFDDLADALRDGEIGWLEARTAQAFGAPSGLELLVVPMLAAGESLGALLVLFDERADLTDAQGRLLRAISATIAFALLRERLVGELSET